MFKDYMGEELSKDDCVVTTWQSPVSPYAIFKIVDFTEKMTRIQRIFPEPRIKNSPKLRYAKELIKVNCKSVTYKVLVEGK